MTTTASAIPKVAKGVSPSRVAIASAIGTTIEWYDFYIFGTASVLVFATQFFPTLDPLAGTLASLATFSVAFIARPLGGAFFGHYGDRIGRKKMLVLSVIVMGAGTLFVGLLPNYDTIGVMAPILLVTCRFLQGFAVGGEWGGAVLMSLEHAPANRRAFYASFPQAGVPAGTFLSAGTFALLTMLPDDAFQAWGWRLPFIASIGLVTVGLWIRLKVTESPEFIETKALNLTPKVPLIDIFRWHKLALLIGILCAFAPNVIFYISTVFMVSYAQKDLGVDGNTVFTAMMIAAAVQVFTVPLFAMIADKYNKRVVLMAGSLLVVLGAFPVFWLFNLSTFWGILAAMFISLPLLHGLSYGVVSGYTAELFPARVRYTGTSMAYQLGSIVTMAPVPTIATLLLANSGTTNTVAIYIAACAFVGFAVVALSKRVVERAAEEQARLTATEG